MATNHKVSKNNFSDTELGFTMAQGKTYDGFTKYLYMKFIFVPELKFSILVSSLNDETVEYNSIDEAINAYNEL